MAGPECTAGDGFIIWDGSSQVAHRMGYLALIGIALLLFFDFAPQPALQLLATHLRAAAEVESDVRS
jgi:hypothetical protein